MKAKAKALYVLVLIYSIGLPSLFLPFESSGENGEEMSKFLEIQAVSPPEERSWMLGERVIAGMSYRQASFSYITFSCRWKIVDDDTDRSYVPSPTYHASNTACEA